LFWDLLHNEEVLLGSAPQWGGLIGLIVLHCFSTLFQILDFSLFYCFLFLIMYLVHTPWLQFNFNGPFKGQINFCFYKEKNKGPIIMAFPAYLPFELTTQLCVFKEILLCAPTCFTPWYIVGNTCQWIC
jgi:hypothetical protein